MAGTDPTHEMGESNLPELTEDESVLPFDEEDGDVIEVEMMEATATVIGSVSTLDLGARQSIICSAAVEGDAEISTSLVGSVNAGSIGLYQGAAAVMLSEGEAAIEQGCAQVLVARSADLASSGVGVLVTGEASLARSWVGVMAARNATLSEDSRVIIDARAALIIGGLIFGGLGLVAVALYIGARRVAARIPHLPWARYGHPGAHRTMVHMPHMRLPDLPELPKLPEIKLPDLAMLGEMAAKLRRAG